MGVISAVAAVAVKPGAPSFDAASLWKTGWLTVLRCETSARKDGIGAGWLWCGFVPQQQKQRCVPGRAESGLLGATFSVCE